MSDSANPTITSLAEEKARLMERLAKIDQLEKLASELGVSISGELALAPAVTVATTAPKQPRPQSFDGTIAGLVQCYRTDERSPYFNLKYRVRNNYDGVLNKIAAEFGQHVIADLTPDRIMGFYNQWAEGGKIAMGHVLAAKFRLLSGYGATILQDTACIPFASIMRTLRFPISQARLVPMTAEHAIAFRAKAHEVGWPSLALAQAIQFELKLRAVDVIGEWIPVSDPMPSTIVWGNLKWVRGLRWPDIDDKLILRYTIVDKVKRQNRHEVDITKLPMVLEELDKLGAAMPTSGPMIICEANDLPYSASEFRRKWRLVANKAHLPDNVRNADSIRATRAEGVQEVKQEPLFARLVK